MTDCPCIGVTIALGVLFFVATATAVWLLLALKSARRAPSFLRRTRYRFVMGTSSADLLGLMLLFRRSQASLSIQTLASDIRMGVLL